MFQFKTCGLSQPTAIQREIAPALAGFFAELGYDTKDYAMACSGNKGQYHVSAWKNGTHEIQAWINRDGRIKCVAQVGEMWYQTKDITEMMRGALKRYHNLEA